MSKIIFRWVSDSQLVGQSYDSGLLTYEVQRIQLVEQKFGLPPGSSATMPFC